MRGDVYRYRPGRNVGGHEEAGNRLAVVVQSEDLAVLSTWIIAPTSTSAAPGPIRPSVRIDGVTTCVQVDQVRAVDPQVRLGEQVGRLSFAELQEVDLALRLTLGLD
ncbi:MAG: type II toxin-antitoxin system PemK/MazF family toxin [Sporichthyaceae bacterium]